MESHRASKEASSRGLRPGDPLSPALFVIAAEVFSRSLNLLLVNPSFYPYAVPRGCPFITHLGYADDIIIFSSGTRKSLDAVMKVIHSYERRSGLLVNVQKSCFVLSPKAYPKRKEITGFYQTYTWVVPYLLGGRQKLSFLVCWNRSSVQKMPFLRRKNNAYSACSIISPDSHFSCP